MFLLVDFYILFMAIASNPAGLVLAGPVFATVIATAHVQNYEDCHYYKVIAHVKVDSDGGKEFATTNGTSSSPR